MAVVRKVIANSKNEITGIVAMKGKTREQVKRRTSSVIKLFTPAIDGESNVTISEGPNVAPLEGVERRGPGRKCVSKYKTV